MGDTAFTCLEWLLKCFNEYTRDLKERYYNKKLCSARVVTENAYGVLKKNGESFTKSASVNCTTSSTLLWPLYYCIKFVSIEMIHVIQDGD